MILTSLYKKAIKQTEINPKQYYIPSPSVINAYYTSYISSYLKNNYAHPVTDT